MSGTTTTGRSNATFSIENALNIAQTIMETYDIVLKAHSRAVYARTGLVHGSFARWRYVHWIDGQDANATPDLASYVAARAIPAYRAHIDRGDLTVPAEKPSGSAWEPPPIGYSKQGQKLLSWDVLNIGPMHYPMLDYGGREDIGPYPAWVAQFVAFKGPNERAYLLKIADLAGSWANHITEVDDRIPNVESKPDFWLLRHNGATDGTNGPANDRRGIRPEWDNDYRHGAWRPETGNAHQPSLAYLPYLITGDRYYADEMRFWANDCIITWNPSLDGKPLSINDDEVRGVAWGLRDLVDAAVYLPDRDPDRVYFRKVVDATIADINAEGQVADTTGFGAMMLGRSAPDDRYIAPTMQLFLAWSLSHAADQGIAAAAGPAFPRLVTPLIDLLLRPSEFPISYVPSWQRWVLRKDGSKFATRGGAPDYAAMFRYNFEGCTVSGMGDAKCVDPVDGHEVFGKDPWFGYHAAEMFPGLLAAKQYGVARAAAALDAMMAYTETASWGEALTMDRELARRSQWALDEFSAPPPSLPDGTRH